MKINNKVDYQLLIAQVKNLKTIIYLIKREAQIHQRYKNKKKLILIHGQISRKESKK